IYNISGQIVKTLADERQQAGRYSVNWDGTDDFGLPLTSGVYLCVLKTNHYQYSHKITLVR
ncbi:MAG: T9SS type A sorting domain-containing protein, partial [bacterium]